MAKNDVNLNELVINRLTKAQYDEALKAGEINDNEFYMTPSEDIEDATQEAHGYMSVLDKIKLDEFRQAEEYVLHSEVDDILASSQNKNPLKIEANGSIIGMYDGSEETVISLDKEMVGLGNVDNTPDSEKHVALADEAITADSSEIAKRLAANAGSGTRPVYFEDGVPVVVDAEIGTAASRNVEDFASAEHTHPTVTQENDGFMAAYDKENLDSLVQKFGDYSIVVSQVDLTPGVSELATGCIYIVYE